MSHKSISMNEKLAELDNICEQCKAGREGQQMESMKSALNSACDACTSLRASLPKLVAFGTGA